MNNITQSLKGAATNGQIPLEKALAIATAVDAERAATTGLLRDCEKQVGMYLGEKINAHIADMEGTRFNAVDYHYEKPVGEQ